ncbi:hypothetical protein PNK_1634 [Candidatus Protochlamydia naegleriophila]|uniref:Uncharacterized protein n=1 Tax=Candidatus Protochlamydia naegleriophila TaxID=389348 RepID=A0A0U5K561_9BACT|nr:hypothetical protein [Candidatus Protochlamydia naegleriophila]CUI17243.1 hypothetical protein PNK_1634 [Candidatus Protochlamydia naegleriophila]
MRLQQFSQELDELTRPAHSHHFKFQLALFSTITYLSTALLTSISPLSSAIFVSLALSISHLVAPLFAAWLEENRAIPLVPLGGQILQLSLSLILAKGIGSLAGYHLTNTQISHVGILFLLTLSVIHFALYHFRLYLQHPAAHSHPN